jgi:AP-4 complex subunit mu-1
LVIGKGSGYGGVILDDCNFHNSVNTEEFALNKTMKILPPDGEL